MSAKFRFYGVVSHASVSPEKGRSALDGVKAIDNMANKMELPVESIENTNQNKYLIKYRVGARLATVKMNSLGKIINIITEAE